MSQKSAIIILTTNNSNSSNNNNTNNTMLITRRRNVTNNINITIRVLFLFSQPTHLVISQPCLNLYSLP